MSKRFLARFYLTIFYLILFASATMAQDVNTLGAAATNNFLMGVVIFLLLVIVVMAFLMMQVSSVLRNAKKVSPALNQPGSLRRWWSNLDKKYFTKAASIEKEADVLLDHDYDGIKELDNALPPWWKWGFYFTIIVGVIYLFRFHVTKTGPTPLDEYNSEMKIAAAKMEIFKKNSKESFDENTVTIADAKGIVDGKKIFTGTCFPCHGANGEGNAVGPNLTDKYWLHGGSLGEVFKTITNGVPDKGMQVWCKTFSPADIRNITSYVLSLQGTNPANAKAPQGNLIGPIKKSDSTAVKKDSLQISKRSPSDKTTK